MRLDPVLLGPWLQGKDSWHQPTHGVFQAAEGGSRLREAMNVDLNDEGLARLRETFVEKLVLTQGQGGYADKDIMLVQDGGSILKVDASGVPWTTAPVVIGLDPDKVVTFCRHATRLFWSNGVDYGEIFADGSTGPWGLAVAPQPVLGEQAGGSLREGRYMVAVTFVDTFGVEHGAPDAAVIDLAADSDLVVNVTVTDPNVAAVKVYASRTNARELFYVMTVPPGVLPVVISNVEFSTEQIRTQHLKPPLAAEYIFAYRGLLLLAVENAVVPSVGIYHHLFEVGHKAEYFPGKVLCGGGVDDGFWTATEVGLFWTVGERPQDWRTFSRGGRKFATGALTISGSFVPFLETDLDVVLFASESGLIAGMPGGSVRVVNRDQVKWDVVGKRASFAARRLEADDPSGNINQILVELY